MMRQIVHAMITALLALGLSVAGFASASASVEMALREGSVEVVLCGDSGAKMVTLDAFGHVMPPRKACERCPACALASLHMAPEAMFLSCPVVRVPAYHRFSQISPDQRGPFGLPLARAPPARL